MVKFLDSMAMTIAFLSALLALLIIFNRKKLSFILSIVGIYLIVSASIEMATTALYYEKANNLKFLHLFTLFEFIIISFLFKNLYKALNSKVNILYVVLPTIFFIITNSFLIQGIDSLNSYALVLSSIIIIGFCIYFFLLILDTNISTNQQITIKWFVICLFFNHSISLIVMLFGELIADISVVSRSYIWVFRSIIILATKIILSYCFIKLFFFSKNLKAHE